MITVVLADDHQMFRQGLRTLIESTKDIKVVGEAGDGQESLRQIEQLQPDVVILDIAMPGLTGIEIAKRLPRIAPKTRSLVLTMHGDTFFALESFKAGALGFMLKEESFNMLINAIRLVSQGKIFMTPSLEAPVLKDLVTGEKHIPDTRSTTLLTNREREILQMVAEGMTNQEIADKLFISICTVDTHRKNIMSKLDIHSVAGLVHYAVRHKMVAI